MFLTQQITPKKRALAWYLNKYTELSYRRIAEQCGILKSSVPQICTQKVFETTRNTTNAMKKRGRPRKVSERDTRTLIRNLQNLRKNNVHVTVKGLVEESGLSFKSASRRTFSRCLN